MQPRSSRDQASQDSSHPEFWDARYARGETPWDFHGVPAALKAFLKTSPTGSALIPGCGSAYEVRVFDEAGWKVMAIDFSPIAVERARSQLGSLADRVVQDDSGIPLRAFSKNWNLEFYGRFIPHGEKFGKYDQQALAEIYRRNPPPPELGFAFGYWWQAERGILMLARRK